MSTKFVVGDHVRWNSEVGHVTGTITRIHTEDVDFKGRCPLHGLSGGYQRTALTREQDAAAIKAAGDGKDTDSEKSDDSDLAYEVEVTRSNGEQVDVHLDQAFSVVRNEVDTED